MTKTVFERARIVDPSRGIDEIGTVIVDGRTILAAGAAALNQGIPEGAQVIDCAGKAIIPGLVDARVFIGEPGGEHRETIRSASQAAAAGGVTSLVMMPDLETEVEMKLPGRFRVSPQIAGAIKAVAGVVDVQQL